MTAPIPAWLPLFGDLPRNDHWCVTCQVHRVQALGGDCPGCLEDRKREEAR